MSEFVRVASVGELDDPGMLLVEVNGNFVILFLVGGAYSCIDDICTHDGGTLSDGELETCDPVNETVSGNQSSSPCIACPRHGAKFDIVTGKALTMPATQDTLAHEVKVEGNDIFVRLNPEMD